MELERVPRHQKWSSQFPAARAPDAAPDRWADMDAIHPMLDCGNHYIDRGTRALSSIGREAFSRKPDASPLGGLVHTQLLRAATSAAA